MTCWGFSQWATSGRVHVACEETAVSWWHDSGRHDPNRGPEKTRALCRKHEGFFRDHGFGWKEISFEEFLAFEVLLS